MSIYVMGGMVNLAGLSPVPSMQVQPGKINKMPVSVSSSHLSFSASFCGSPSLRFSPSLSFYIYNDILKVKYSKYFTLISSTLIST